MIVRITWGCVCRDGKVCVYHAMLGRIEEGCRLGGISLEQRLAAIDYSTIAEQRREAAIIRHALATKQA